LIVCKQCGHHNEDSDTFCGSCGKFLEWTGERVVAPEPEPEPIPAAPEPETVHLGFMDRVKHAVGLEEETPTQTAESAPTPAPNQTSPPPPIVRAAPMAAAAAQAPAAPVAAAPLAATPLTPAPAAPPGTVASSPAAPPAAAWPPAAPAPSRPEFVAAPPVAPTPPVPATPAYSGGLFAPVTQPVVSPDEPTSRRPTAVAPTIARPRPAARTMEAPTRHRPGDLICGQCGEGNEPARHFCRRCGNTLDEAIAVRLPWYRRFFNRVFHPRTREAGWRPQRVGRPNVLGMVFRLVRLAVLALIVVGLLAFLFVPPFHNLVVDRATSAFTTIRKAVHPNIESVHPTGASASTSIAGHLPGLAIDNGSNTYWAALAKDRAPELTVNFGGPVDLAQIGFTSGASGAAPADHFVNQPRPKQVHLVFSNGTTKDLTLSDEGTAKFYPISANQVTFVQIHIISTYLPEGASPSSVAITEVEFKTEN